MNYKTILFLLAASVLICFHLAEAQQAGKVFRIGFLDSSTASGMAGPRGGVPAGDAEAWMD